MKNAIIDKSVWQKWRDFEIGEESPDFFLGLLEITLATSPQKMQELVAAAAKKDFKVVAYCAHTLASTCGSLGAMVLNEELKRLENACRSTPPGMTAEAVESVRSGLASFISQIQAERDNLKSAA